MIYAVETLSVIYTYQLPTTAIRVEATVRVRGHSYCVFGWVYPSGDAGMAHWDIRGLPPRSTRKLRYGTTYLDIKKALVSSANHWHTSPEGVAELARTKREALREHVTHCETRLVYAQNGVKTRRRELCAARRGLKAFDKRHSQ